MRGSLKSRLTIALLRWFPFRKPKAKLRHVRREVWSHSTQRMGVRFTERIREMFRRRWLKVVRGENTQERDA